MLIRAGIEVNGFIRQSVPNEMVPVDSLAKAIVSISLNNAALGHNFNLNVQQDITGEKLKDWLTDCGYTITMNEYSQWYQKVVQKAKKDPGSTCAQLMPLLPTTMGEPLKILFDDANTRKYYDTDKNFRVGDVKTFFQKTIRFFQGKDVIAAPGKAEDVYNFDVLPSEFLDDFE